MITILRSPEVLQACCVAVSAQADAPIPISSSGISGTNGTIFGDVQGLSDLPVLAIRKTQMTTGKTVHTSEKTSFLNPATSGPHFFSRNLARV